MNPASAPNAGTDAGPDAGTDAGPDVGPGAGSTGAGDDRAARLSYDRLASLQADLAPPIDPRDVRVGLIHLGPGAFHRAHQASYTEDAIAAAGGDWGICAVSSRSHGMVEALRPQDGLFTLLLRSADSVSGRVVGSLREVLHTDSHRKDVLARFADPRVSVCTLTVTEKGYHHDRSTGGLASSDPQVSADLAGRWPRTTVGLLVQGLRARMRADAGPLTLVSCDNLSDNGAVLRHCLTDFLTALPDPADSRALLTWTRTQVGFSSTVIDRIVPAPTQADRDTALRMIGCCDEATVSAEPHRQWILQDSFVGPRPAWERAGAIVTDDIRPYAVVKLRLLNGSHTALAVLGGLAGAEWIAQALAGRGFPAYLRALIDRDLRPTLSTAADIDLDGYRESVLTRFANTAIRYGTHQVARDSSQKLPQRLVSPILEGRVAGLAMEHALLAVAGWMTWAWKRLDDSGRQLPLDDPLADDIAAAVREAATPAQAVDQLLGLTRIFAELGADSEARRTLHDMVTDLDRHGAAAVVARSLR